MSPLAVWRFAQAYRARAGYPHRHLPQHDPSDLGLAFEAVRIPSGGVDLAGWWIPQPDGVSAPAVLLVHGWESARDRTLPNAQLLHALGLHVLTIDIRGHGENSAEEMPVTAGEFGEDALAAVRWLLDRADVTSVGVLGHSMGGIGALLAAAAEPRVGAVVSASTPADPYRLTRQTFRLARLPLPGPLAYPLAWLATHVMLQPRGHTVRSISATRAIETYRGPILLLHGDADTVVPFSHLGRLAARALRSRQGDPEAGSVEVLALPGAPHSWLYEIPAYRAAVARFLTEHLGGRVRPDEAAAIGAALRLHRPEPRSHVPGGFAAIRDEPGGFRTIWRAVREGGGVARP